MRRHLLSCGLAAVLLAGCSSSDPEVRAWRAALQQARLAKDEFMRGPDSPLDVAQRRSFAGLAYFAPRRDWVVEAMLEPAAVPDTVRFVTSTRTVEPFLRHGLLRFRHDGRALALTVFRSPEGHLFLPFQDETSGRETYGAGRYLELEPLPGAWFRLDFNRAYNPYCAYNSGWTCPIPPAENRLPVRVEAGEKSFHD
jgi:uncharacterized protein (DUF1684 family)